MSKSSSDTIQIIRKNRYPFWGEEYRNCENVRSFSTGFTETLPIVDGDFSNLVIADFNFDMLDDLAFIYDYGS